MVLIILSVILILAIAFFQIIQGLYSSLIMAILTVLCATVAFTFYEPAAQLLYDVGPGYADALALIAIFTLPLLVLRILSDKYLGANVVLGVWADRIGGGALGLLTGMICTGILMIAVQMLPFGRSIIMYEPFDGALERQASLAPFFPDEFTLGLMKTFSTGSLRSSRSFAKAHEDLLLEAYCARNTAGANGRTDATPDALKGIGVYKAPELRFAPWIDELPRNPLLREGEIPEVYIVRFQIDASARDESEAGARTGRWRLPATHFRMVSSRGRSYYPLAYLTYGRGEWEVHGAKQTDGEAQIADLIVSRPTSRKTKSLVIDWVYTIPSDERPSYLSFRRTGKIGIASKGKKGVKIREKRMPPRRGALDRRGEGK